MLTGFGTGLLLAVDGVLVELSVSAGFVSGVPAVDSTGLSGTVSGLVFAGVAVAAGVAGSPEPATSPCNFGEEFGSTGGPKSKCFVRASFSLHI